MLMRVLGSLVFGLLVGLFVFTALQEMFLLPLEGVILFHILVGTFLGLSVYWIYQNRRYIK